MQKSNDGKKLGRPKQVWAFIGDKPISIAVIAALWIVAVLAVYSFISRQPLPRKAPTDSTEEIATIKIAIVEQDKIINNLQQHVIDILHNRCRVLEDRVKGICDCEVCEPCNCEEKGDGP